MFKEKSSKKRLCTTENAKDSNTHNSTLDAKHNEMITKLLNDKSKMVELEQEYNSLDTTIQNLQNVIKTMKMNMEYDTEQYDDIWTSNIQCEENKKSIKKLIDQLRSAEEEINYYDNTGYILFNYYNIIEGTTDNLSPSNVIQRLPNISHPKNRKKQSNNMVASKSILEAFNIGTNTVKAKEGDKSKLVEEYLTRIDNSYLKSPENEDTMYCKKCNNTLLCIQNEGVMICSSCGYQDTLLVEQNRPILRCSSKDVISHASYKRINHFREWCSQVQGKESTEIPEYVFEQILCEIKKQKITDTRKISYSKMREILKKLNLNRYYEHSNYIINRINGVQPPHFPPELEEKLCSMFKEIQGPFVRHCPQMRSNFLSYSYVLYKFFQILNLNQYLKWFTLLKSKSKLYMQDQIFKAICADLGWKFTPSL